MEAKKLLLSSLSNNDYTNGFNQYNSDMIDFLTVSEHHQICHHLYQYCNDLIVQLNLDDDEIIDSNITNYEVVLKQLKVVVQIVTMYTDLPQYRFIELLNTVQLLHDILIPLNNDLQGALSLKTAIARICEHWWKKNENGAENLITQLIPFLLLSSLGPDAIDADVKRLYQIREAMTLFDFEDPSIESIRTLILRCFIHPAFLRNAEGQKFLSFVFSLSPALHQYILEVIKPQLAAGIKTIATCYGEILYKAWKDSKSDTHNEISSNQQFLEELFQVIVHESIHAADQKYFRSLRSLMRVLHDHKRLKDVDSMLLRIYGPILWRSLRCANAIVRSQASTLFFDAFPLQDSDGTAAEVDVILQKQFDLLTSLLKDEDHRVRATAASGVCHILTEYWEALPPTTTKQILSFIVGTLGFDASNANVRLAVLTGLNELLEQPLSHNILKNLLPLLANAIHDKSEKNRVAFIKILTKVKSIQNMHFYKIVSVDNLLLRLADDEDKPAVCKAMTSLLVNSFYPQGDGISFDIAKVLRSLNLIRQNLPAAQAFYGNLIFNNVSVGSVTKFCWLLFSLFISEKRQLEALLLADGEDNDEYEGEAEVKTKRGRAKGKVNNDDGFDLATSILTDSNLQSGMLTVILSCLMSIKSKLDEDQKSFIEGKFNETTIKNVLKIISSVENNGSNPSIPIFMRIVSILVDLRIADGQNFTPINYNMVVQELDEVMKNPDDRNYRSQMIASMELLCTLGRKDILIQKVKSSFASFLKSKNKDDQADTLKGAVEILCLFIESDNATIAATRDNMISTEEEIFTSLFSSVKDILETALKSDKFINARETFLRCAHLWSSYAVRKTFASKLSDDSGLTNVEEIESLGHWITENVIPIICSFDASEYKRKIAQQLLASVMLVLTDALILDVGAAVIFEAFIDWTRTLDIYTSHCQEQGHEEYPIRFLIPMLARVSFMISTRDKLLVSCGHMKISLFNILKSHCGLLIADITNDASDSDTKDVPIAIAKLAAGKAIVSNLKMSSSNDWDPIAVFINEIIDNMVKFNEFKTNSSKVCYELLKLSPEIVQSKSIAYITAYISFMLGAKTGSTKLYNGFASVTLDNHDKNQILKDLCQVLHELTTEGSDKHIEHSKTLVNSMFDVIMKDPQVDKENYDITRAFEVLQVR